MPLESKDHPNQRNSFYFGIGVIGSILISYLIHLAWGVGKLHKGLFLPIALVCVIVGIVNMLNVFEKNKNWKTVAAVVAILSMLAVTVLPIVEANGGW